MDYVVVAKGLTHNYGNTPALTGIDLKIQTGRLIGLVGPDGVGKSTFLSLVAGSRKLQQGDLHVLSGDMRSPLHRLAICPRIAYMPQGLGRNLYLTLSVFENVDFFGRLFGQDSEERQWRIDELLQSTGLAPFRGRPAGKLSGGMKQKLGLCCSLIHDPDLLILDEPTTGVDPLSRRQFWDLINRIRERRENMSVLVSTAYMDEAQTFEYVIAMDAGNVLSEASPTELMARTETDNLDAAFIQLLPEERRKGHKELVVPPRVHEENAPLAISAKDLTQRFGTFTAVDHVSFNIERGEIFGFLGSNGCGKTTTMKMLTGLLPPTEGQAWISGTPVNANDIEARRRIGFMSQAFSLYRELTVRQNLALHARLFRLAPDVAAARTDEMVQRFDLGPYLDQLPESLPLGIRQRLSLAVAVIHNPEILILDEPTSGVDPVARDAFWELLIRLSRDDSVTIFVSTHFMNEAARCDRISLMHTGKVLAIGVPEEIVRQRNTPSLEAAFIGYLEAAAAQVNPTPTVEAQTSPPTEPERPTPPRPSSALTEAFSPKRIYAYARRESLELLRDPIRQVFAVFGTVLLMFAFGYGISLDVEHLPFAVFDQQQSPESRDFIYNISSSRYFDKHAPIHSSAGLDRRMRDGELAMAIEIPPGFSKDLYRGAKPDIAAWVDGSNPFTAATAEGYLNGLQERYLRLLATKHGVTASVPINIQTRFLYNQDFKSIIAMVPGVIALLLILFPAMLTALGVVREKELGSITNLYVTPVTRLEFLLGKQIPYILLGMINYLGLVVIAILVFGVPLKGSFLGLTLAALIYIAAATGIGLLISAFTTSQLAALFGTAILTILPSTQFCGLITPVSSLTGGARVIGNIYPTTYFLKASVGAFTKGLSFDALLPFITVLAITVPIVLVVALMFVRKQEA